MLAHADPVSGLETSAPSPWGSEGDLSWRWVRLCSHSSEKKREELGVLNGLCSLLEPLLGCPARQVNSAAGKPKKKKKKKADDESSTHKGPDNTSFGKLLEAFLASVKAVKPGTLKAKKATADKPTWADVAKTSWNNQTQISQKTAKKTVVTSLAKQCRPHSEVRDFGEIWKKLEDGAKPDGSISLTPTVAKGLEGRELAQGHKLDVKFACVVASQELDDLPAE